MPKPEQPKLPPPPQRTKPHQRSEHEHRFETKLGSNYFRCDGCKLTRSGERYRCKSSNCDKVFHKECKYFKETEGEHNHKYELKSYKKIFKCDGCKEEGFGKRIRCDQCGRELHARCKFPENHVYVKWLTELPFQFHRNNKSTRKLVCGACTNDIDGYFYHCAKFVSPPGTEYGLYLHPCCMKLEHVIFADVKKAQDGTPLNNKGEQRFTLSDKVKKGKKCHLCKHNTLKNRDNQGLSYVCDEGEHCFHVYCVWEVVHESWVNGNRLDDKGVLGKIEACRQLDMKNNNSGELLDSMTKKILKTILKMIISTLMGDPTLGIIHVFALFNN